MIHFIQQDFKSIINKYKWIDPWFWCRYSINTYNGCQFGCIYCDARSAKYHLPTDFENQIIIKNKAAEMLDKRLSGACTFLADVVALSGTTDPYQPAERKYKNTRGCLEVLQKYKYPVHICTKSTLLLRDLDLLNSIGRSSWCAVSVTITTTDEKKARFLETRAPSPKERFEVIQKIKTRTRHIQTGVLLIPTIPFITDASEQLEEIVKTSKESGADYLIFSSALTIRDTQGLWFLKNLKKVYPELIAGYEKLYDFKYHPDLYDGRYEIQSAYARKINLNLLELCQKYDIPFRIKRYIPRDYRKVNYQIAEKFLNSAYKKQLKGTDWKTSFWAGQSIQNLKESVLDIAARNELHKINNVSRPVENYLKEFLVKLNE